MRCPEATVEEPAREPTPEPTHGPTTRRPLLDLRPALVDAGIVLVWFLAAGVIGALLWSRLVDLPTATRTQGGATMGPIELVKQVSVDGWFFVIAAVGGLLSGFALSLWRRSDPILTVLLVILGAGLASYVMIRVGAALGPADPEVVLRSKPDGATALAQLKLQATGAAWVWPIAAALGSLFLLWVTPHHDEPAEPDHPDADHD